ncbi:TetR/AcrR family transcriptional regulator [Paenibacillus alkalitolerans]|uniref:TetR/AcrR family transcriptional regulator n=1 Tax=Paenibacillus alkalitolerans TaxID=2799335 RepID=UPI0018F78178|nr:TetR/AcrR family transcriptional regulator [Paenibacillus alkalitolerans]
MTIKMDRRKIRTKQLLRKALLELIEEKGMDGLTVSDLTERAGVNRGTFYLHYRDAADFLEQLKTEIFEGLTHEMARINPFELKYYADKDEPYPPSVKVLEYFDKHADFFRVILGPKGDPAFPLRVKEFMKDRLFNHVLKNIPQPDDAAIPRDYLIAYVTSANLGILMHWFESGRQLSPSDVARIITRIGGDGPMAWTGLK